MAEVEAKIETLDLSVRTWSALKRNGIDTIPDVLKHGKRGLEGIRNFGLKSIDEVIAALIKKGYFETVEELEKFEISFVQPEDFMTNPQLREILFRLDKRLNKIIDDFEKRLNSLLDKS